MNADVVCGAASFTCIKGNVGNQQNASSCNEDNKRTCSDGSASTNCTAPKLCYECGNNGCKSIPVANGDFDDPQCNNMCGSVPSCGNNVKEGGEQCDGSALGGWDSCNACV